MSERRLLYSPLSRKDLDDIFDYIANELENPSAAGDVVGEILDRAEELESFPFIGSIVEGLPFASDEYRFLGVLYAKRDAAPCSTFSRPEAEPAPAG